MLVKRMNVLRVLVLVLGWLLCTWTPAPAADLAWEFEQQGWLCNQSHNYQQAIALFNRSINANSNHEPAYLGRGCAYRELGHTKAALRDFDQALKLNAKDARIYTNRGVLYQQLGDYDQSLAEYEKAIALEANTTPALAGRGQIYTLLGEFDKSSQDFQKLVRLEPKYHGWHVCYGDCLLNSGNYKEAVVQYGQAINLCSKNLLAGIIQKRGRAYCRLKSYKLALADFTRAQGLKPRNASVYNDLATAYFGLGEKRKAIEALTKLLSYTPRDATARRRRADAYFESKSYNEAIEDYKKVAELKPEYVDNYQKLAEAYELSGHPELASKELARAKEMNERIRQ